ncbi:MAG TPA: hypothetical protein V6C52_14335 [Coleofasciculaceae cyanobacterium]|jgi:hypothetical protein
MSDRAPNPKKRLKGLDILKHGLLLKLALVRHQEQEVPVDALTGDIRKINEELETTYLKARESYPGSVEEANCLVRIRELEDIRFQLLSQKNGNHLEAYNTLAPKYRYE